MARAARSSSSSTVAERKRLRRRIVRSLGEQGFEWEGGRVVRGPSGKAALRELHTAAVQHRRERARPGLERHQNDLLGFIADGGEVDPKRIAPRLVEVQRNSVEELLFRFVALHWSIPVSSGYGRRLRFLVMDDSTGKLMGLFGLGDPVMNVRARDQWVGWGGTERGNGLQHVLEAFVVGAVPPYSRLLGGKLVALLLASREVRMAFKRKYRNTKTVISNREFNGQLYMITTQSALGRSSIYNRLRFRDQLVLRSVGYTAGFGEFHFSNGLYADLSAYAQRYCEPSAKAGAWGSGFRNRREVIRKALVSLGLPTDWNHHGVRREVFVAPLAANTKNLLLGKARRGRWLYPQADELAAWWAERWLTPRVERCPDFQEFRREDYRLWDTQ